MAFYQYRSDSNPNSRCLPQYNAKQRECQKYKDECQILQQRLKRTSARPTHLSLSSSTSRPSSRNSSSSSLLSPSSTGFVTARSDVPPRIVSSSSDPGLGFGSEQIPNTDSTVSLRRRESGSTQIPAMQRWSTHRPISAYDNPPTIYACSVGDVSELEDSSTPVRSPTRTRVDSAPGTRAGAGVILFPAAADPGGLRRWRGPSSLLAAPARTDT